jgi:hypothetical protein
MRERAASLRAPLAASGRGNLATVRAPDQSFESLRGRFVGGASDRRLGAPANNAGTRHAHFPEGLESIMKMSEPRTKYVTRGAILKLLSDEEVARVSMAETDVQLVDGDEYVDLGVPDRGLQAAQGGSKVPMGQVLPRKAVLEATWRKILKLIAAGRSSA